MLWRLDPHQYRLRGWSNNVGYAYTLMYMLINMELYSLKWAAKEQSGIIYNRYKKIQAY